MVLMEHSGILELVRMVSIRLSVEVAGLINPLPLFLARIPTCSIAKPVSAMRRVKRWAVAD